MTIVIPRRAPGRAGAKITLAWRRMLASCARAVGGKLWRVIQARAFAKNTMFRHTHTGDAPEAAKTAIVELLKHVDKPTVVIWYADAPPHHKQTGYLPEAAFFWGIFF